MYHDDPPDTTGRTPEAIRAMIAEREELLRRMRRDGSRRTRPGAYARVCHALDVLRARLVEATRRQDG
jgi:hypothetical protein